MTSQAITAAAAGTWTLGDLVVNRIGFGAMRLPQRGEAFAPGAVPRDRDEAVGVLRRAVELGVNHIDTAAFYFSALRSANELIGGPSHRTRTTWSSPRRSAPAGTGRVRGSRTRRRGSCARRWSRTCGSSAGTTSTW